MPNQTNLKNYIYFPDGAQVLIKADGDSTYSDLGTISQGVTCTYNYDVNDLESGNAGQLRRQVRNMTMTGGFTLWELNQDTISKLGGGMLTVENVAGTLVADADITDQTIAAGWADQTVYDLDPIETSTGNVLRLSSKPTITSVTLDPTGTPEVLAENTDYVIAASTTSKSGWTIQFLSANMSTGSPKTFEIVIDFGDNTPVASKVVYAGASTFTLNSYALQIKHADDNGKVRQYDLYSVYTDSGGLQFNMKGANEDGVEEMPIAFTAKIDTSRTSGKQLFSWSVDTDAA